MKTKIIYTLCFMLITSSLFALTTIDPETIRQAQLNVCAIKVINEPKTVNALGCGVVLRTKVKNNTGYFVATAYHIVRELSTHQDLKAEISVFDNNGNMYQADQIKASHIIWSSPAMDAALLVLPGNLSPIEQLPEGYEFPGLASLKLIGEPSWGEDIYLFGYRWLNQHRFIDILKKGILSVGTKELPGYEGHLVYLIDNMANKGMSGGLAFNSEGIGIGIISSYVYETGQTFNSDDLSVCLPLTMYFNALASAVISKNDEILRIFND